MALRGSPRPPAGRQGRERRAPSPTGRSWTRGAPPGRGDQAGSSCRRSGRRAPCAHLADEFAHLDPLVLVGRGAVKGVMPRRGRDVSLVEAGVVRMVPSGPVLRRHRASRSPGPTHTPAPLQPTCRRGPRGPIHRPPPGTRISTTSSPPTGKRRRAPPGWTTTHSSVPTGGQPSAALSRGAPCQASGPPPVGSVLEPGSGRPPAGSGRNRRRRGSPPRPGSRTKSALRHAEFDPAPEDVGLRQPDERGLQADRRRIRRPQVDRPLERLDELGPAVRVARVVEGLDADDDRLRPAGLGVARRDREEVSVPERYRCSAASGRDGSKPLDLEGGRSGPVTEERRVRSRRANSRTLSCPAIARSRGAPVPSSVRSSGGARGGSYPQPSG